MENFSNKVVYLTDDGARRMFGNQMIAGLPVIPTDPCNVDGTVVYGDIFTEHNGQHIGGCLSEDGFCTMSPPEMMKQAAIMTYDEHCAMIDEKYGRRNRGNVNVQDLLAVPQRPIPTLDERARELNLARGAVQIEDSQLTVAVADVVENPDVANIVYDHLVNN